MLNRVSVFDAFGTLVQIKNPQRPYAELKALLNSKGVFVASDYSRIVMTRPLNFEEVAFLHGCSLSESENSFLNEMLEEELASIEPFEDSLMALERCVSRGDLVVVGSNLAKPYGKVVEDLLQAFGVVGRWNQEGCLLRTGFSFDLGLVKPEIDFYKEIEFGIRASAELSKDVKFFMVGDKEQEDCLAPQKLGWNSWQVQRKNGVTLLNAPNY